MAGTKNQDVTDRHGMENSQLKESIVSSCLRTPNVLTPGSCHLGSK